MFCKRSSTVKYSVAALVGAVLFCEWFVYLAQPLLWPTLRCHQNPCTRVLFVADPQIQGDTAVAPPLSYLYNWDSDRYLKSTFSVVIKNFKPDVLVYLGDLTDEGSIATMEQFHGYVKRLANIFDIDYPVVQIWLPGDNDIGGEGEPVKKEKVEEFAKVFRQSDIVTFHNISFYKVNAITHTIPHLPDGFEDNNYKIVVSHYPLTNKHAFLEKLNTEIRPDIFFSAHDHESKYVMKKRGLTQRQQYWSVLNSTVMIQTPNDWQYEISVPTCSYRMGTSNIGYGAALIEQDNMLLQYAVLWSPQRFLYLLFYALVLIFLCLYFIVYYQSRLIHYCKASKTKFDDVPLLKRI